MKVLNKPSSLINKNKTKLEKDELTKKQQEDKIEKDYEESVKIFDKLSHFRWDDNNYFISGSIKETPL